MSAEQSKKPGKPHGTRTRSVRRPVAAGPRAAPSRDSATDAPRPEGGFRGLRNGWARTPPTPAPVDRAVALVDGGALAWSDDATTWRLRTYPDLEWAPGPALPGPAYGSPGIRLADGSVLIVGGPDGRQVWRWVAEAPVFEVLSPLRAARYGPALVPVGLNGALVVGGLATGGRAATLVEGITPYGNFVRGELRRPRPEPLAARVGELIIILGPDGAREAPEVWPVAEGDGEVGRPVPEPRTSAAILAFGTRLLRVGGERVDGSGHRLPTATHVFDPIGDEWRAAGHLATARCRTRLVPWGTNACLAVGGSSEEPKVVARVERFDGWRWTRQGTLTVGRVDHDAVLLDDGRVLVIGGRTLGDLAPPFGELSSRP